MKLLTLDLATTTGWAFGPISDSPSFGSFTLESTGSNLGLWGARFVAWLNGRFEEWQPEFCVFEAPILPRKTSLQTTRKLQGLCMLVEVLCHKNKIECREVAALEARRFFVGSTRKETVIPHCRALGYETTDGDAADAIAIFAFMVGLYDRDKGTRHADKFNLLLRRQAMAAAQAS